MEQLKDILLLEFRGFTVHAFEAVLITLSILGFFVLAWVLLGKILPWYYGKETVTEDNRSRVSNVARFTLVSFLVIVVLKILDIDFTFYDDNIKELADGSGDVTLTIKISTIIRALVAFIVAGVLDLILEEFLLQRFHRRHLGDGPIGPQDAKNLEGTKRRFSAIAPLMYTLAVGFVAEDTGIADYYADIQGYVITVGNIISAVFVFQAVRLFLLILTTFFLSSYYKRSNVDPGSQYAINRLLSYFIYLIGVLLVIQAAGFNLVVIWTGAAALLVGIGIGLQQTFNDLICGVIILFERSVMVGDVVELSGHQVGTVRKVGARTSTVETRDDIIIFVPNSKLIGENVTNWSHVQRIARFHVKVGVAYGSDTALVKRLLEEVAAGHDRVAKTPAPFVRFLDFGDSSLDFDLLFWSRDFTRIENVKSDLRFAIDAAFRANKVEIPFPQRDLWVKGGAGLEAILRQQRGGDAGANPPEQPDEPQS